MCALMNTGKHTLKKKFVQRYILTKSMSYSTPNWHSPYKKLINVL